MPDRHLINPIFISGIDLLRGIEYFCDLGLFQVPVLPQLPQNLRIGLQDVPLPGQVCPSGILFHTLDMMY